jgi:hypothetical protein
MYVDTIRIQGPVESLQRFGALPTKDTYIKIYRTVHWDYQTSPGKIEIAFSSCRFAHKSGMETLESGQNSFAALAEFTSGLRELTD